MLQVANMPQYKLKGAQIEEMRREQRVLIIEEMIRYKSKVNEKFAKFDFEAVENKAVADPRFDHT